MLNDTGVDYCGILVNASFSPRSVSPVKAREIASATTCEVVILLCNPTVELGLQVFDMVQPYALQLQCIESPELVAEMRSKLPMEIWKALHLPWLGSQAAPQAYLEAGVDRLLFDAQVSKNGEVRYGGTGVTADWILVRQQMASLPEVPCFVAGGIGPKNLRTAVETALPFGVDLCSGVESRTGQRDPDLLKELLDEWRNI